MKKVTLILALLIGFIPLLNAQWTSPGNGTTYTMPDLVAASNGVVTNTGNVFAINADLTISENDILNIDDQVTRIDAPGALITIKGSMVCNNSETNRVKIYGTMTSQFSMRFENAINCELKHMYFSDGCGIKVIESEVTFDDVKFLYFTRDYASAVIDIFNCDPVIKNCYFQDNEGAAISSPANGQSSPQILNNSLDANVNGINSPQINLGPGGEDTIRIVGNTIDDHWAQWHVGGISVADLMGVGSTKVLLKDNIVKEGRYGYNQQGATISSVIVGNQFIDNYNEENPMNGGSGISIYGTTVNNKAVLRDNVITGNLWGITAIYMHDINMGTEDDWGNNEIHDNYNSGMEYDLYNNSICDITAVGNSWGTTSEEMIENHIFHQNDDPSLGLVIFIPFIGYDALNELETTAFEVWPNPVSDGAFNLVLDEATPSEMVIYSLNGQKVMSQHIENKVNTININALENGIYIIEVKNAEKTLWKRFVIE
jgi:hypothetical protein